ncbi:MAG: S8 family serine peptidase [Nitrospirales bacterium]
MTLTSGKPNIKIGVIDGPVATDHPDFNDTSFHVLPGNPPGICSRSDSIACSHGTFVVGILSARRQSIAPSICPGCSLVIRSIFPEKTVGNSQMPSADPLMLATGILENIAAGVRIINLSLDLSPPTVLGQQSLEEALNYAAQQGVIIVAAAGNQATIGSSVITRHPWVIPVVACNLQGKPTGQSNLANSISKRGLSAPGNNITSIGIHGKPRTFSGTSAAAPFVTGTVALLWSQFPKATATQVKFALTQGYLRRQASLVPPLLNAWAAYQFMRKEFNLP